MHTSLATLGRIAALSVGFICTSHATARADIDACGEIDVRPKARCEVIPPSAQCKTMCTPLNVRATCSAKLAVDCQAGCDELPSAQCNVDCEAGCRGRCQVDPGKFECAVDCRASCEGSCEASCAANSDKTGCMASCSGACSVGCDSQCDVELPSASCDVQCKASCEGSCEVKTNIDCQVDCQADGRLDCEAEVTGGCMTQCEAMEGALFCDGQFIDTDNLKECADALVALLDVEVDWSASGSSSCTDGSCMAEGQASVSSDCTVAHVGGGSGHTRAGLFGVVGLLGLGFVVRRRKKH